MYHKGDCVKYRTSNIKTINYGEIIGSTKVGIIEEAFHTLDLQPCYWIKGEKELILHRQIIGKERKN